MEWIMASAPKIHVPHIALGGGFTLFLLGIIVGGFSAVYFSHWRGRSK